MAAMASEFWNTVGTLVVLYHEDVLLCYMNRWPHPEKKGLWGWDVSCRPSPRFKRAALGTHGRLGSYYNNFYDKYVEIWGDDLERVKSEVEKYVLSLSPKTKAKLLEKSKKRPMT